MNGKYKNIPHTYLLEAMRNSSHNTTTAAAEFVDNSLDAEAENIWITFDKKNYRMLVADDGIGMTDEQLLKAVALGCHENMDAKLGRFGVGLNTSALHLGETFSVYSKTDDGILHRVDFDPATMMTTGEWENNITDQLSEEEKQMFDESVHNNASGTVIVINGIDRHFKSPQSVYQFSKTLMKNLGEMFRSFLPPQILGSNDVSDEAAKNSRLRLYIDDECVSGKDPLERLAPNTSVYAVGIIETKLGPIDYTIVELSDTDINVQNYPPDYFHQGFYVMREGRQIMAHDTTVFEDIWKGRHSTGTHLRAEIRYSKALDPLLLVNHDKVGIKEVAEGTMDELKRVLKPVITQFKQNWQARVSKKPNEEIDKIHEATAQNLAANAAQLNLPSQRKADRQRGKSKGLTKPKSDSKGGKHSPLKKDGDPKKQKVRDFKVLHADLTAAGPAFTFEFAANNTLIVTWNTSHPFVQKFITLHEDSPTETIKGLDNIAFAVAAYWEQAILTGDEEAWNQKDNFLGVLSQNLRVVR